MGKTSRLDLVTLSSGENSMRSLLSFTLIATLVVSVRAPAADSCENLAKEICSEEGQDSTGFSRGDDEDGVRVALAKKYEPAIKAIAADTFAKMKAKGLDKTFAQKMSAYPECASGSITKACEETMEIGVRNMIWSNLTQHIDTPTPSWAEKAPKGQDFTFFEPVGLLSSIDDLQKKIISDASESKEAEDIRKIFPSIKKEVGALLPELISDPATLKIAEEKLKPVDFGGFGCNERGYSKIHDFCAGDSHLDPKTKKVHLCYGLAAANTSKYAMAEVLAHEIAHSFDGCNLNLKDATSGTVSNSGGVVGTIQGMLGGWTKKVKSADDASPYRAAIECLRDPKSIGAVNKAQKFDPTGKFPIHCSDQISESFADLVAVETVVRLSEKGFFGKNQSAEDQAKGMKNAMRHLCTSRRFDAEKEVHPHFNDRIGKILLAHPKVRKTLGCAPLDPKKMRYCDVFKDGADSTSVQKRATGR